MTLLLAAVVAGCSTLTPQIFSDRFLRERNSPQSLGKIELADALTEAEELQRKYIASVRELSEFGSGSSAALIGLSLLGVFKGVTHPNGHDLVGLGLAGSGLYAYNTTMTSRPRQMLYLAGAEALACAMTASRPYSLQPGWLRPATPPDGSSVQELIDKLDMHGRRFDGLLDDLKPYTREQREVEPSHWTRPPGCDDLPAELRFDLPGAFAARAASAPADPLRDLRLRQQQAARAACVAPERRERLVKPPPAVLERVEQIERMQRQLDRLVKQARHQTALVDSAGNALWDRVLAVQLKVATEVLKTEPDIGAVMASAQVLRQSAFSLGGAPGLKDPPRAARSSDSSASAAGKSESDPLGRSRLARTTAPVDVRTAEIGPSLQAGLDLAETLLRAARLDADRLQGRLAELSQRVSAASTKLTRCATGAAAQSLQVVPADDSLEVAVGKTQAFVVSGGAGVPRAAVIALGGASHPGSVRPSIDDQGNVVMTYSAHKDAADGDQIMLRFSDGAGVLTHQVLLTLRKARSSEGAG